MAIRAGLALFVLAVVITGVPLPGAVYGDVAQGDLLDGGPNNGGIEIDAPIVIETVDESIDPTDPALVAEMARVHDAFEPGRSRSVAAPVASWPVSWPQAAAVNSGLSVTFDGTHTAPANVQAVVLAAAQLWDDALATTPAGPVEIAVIWRDLGSPGLLGSAGPNGLYSSSQLPTSSFYPVGQVNTLLGVDQNGASNPELLINLNSTPNWYVGTGTPGFGEVDLFSVVLHEIGHGMGFLGSASTGNDPGPSPTLNSRPFVYDEEVTHNGQPLLSASDPNGLLSSGNLRIDLSSSLDAKLYLPGTWQEGSSYSHFDEATYPTGQPGALMTPSLASGQVERTLDAAVLGVLARTGWPMRATAVTPTITSVDGSASSVAASWSTDLRAFGLAPDGHRVEALRNGTILDASVDLPATTTSTTLTGLQPGANYTLRIVPHAVGVDGTPALQSFTTDGTPTAPAIVTATGPTLTQTVEWSASSGIGLTGYEVQRSTDGVNWVPLGSTGGLSLTVTVPHGVHQYRVRGLNGFGAGSWGYSIPTGASAGVARPVPLDGQIERLYRAYFLRDPDAVGFAHWQGERAGGASLVDIASVFAASDEFIATYGPLSDTQFVELVYQNVLNRPSDSAGLAHWVSVLAAGGSRGSVMVGFSESSEYITQTGTVAPTSVAEGEIYRLYVAFFVRFPEAGGMQYWTGVRSGGASLESIGASFAASGEFQATYGSLSDEAFVELVYNNVLGRTADAGGLAHWVGQLAAGVDRGTVMVGLSESPEFIVATGTIP